MLAAVFTPQPSVSRNLPRPWPFFFLPSLLPFFQCEDRSDPSLGQQSTSVSRKGMRVRFDSDDIFWRETGVFLVTEAIQLTRLFLPLIFTSLLNYYDFE
jgi:hypothetical protein